MIRFGHNNAISMDSTFGTSRVQFLLYIFLVFDDHRSGFPTAWVITNRETEDYVTKFMEALKRNVQLHSPTFTPTCFVVDDNDATHNAIR